MVFGISNFFLNKVFFLGFIVNTVIHTTMYALGTVNNNTKAKEYKYVSLDKRLHRETFNSRLQIFAVLFITVDLCLLF